MSNDLTLLGKFHTFRRKYFPERQLFLRSEGRVRFVTFGSYVQMSAASALAIAVGWGLVTSYHYLTRDEVLEAKNRTITNMSAQYQALSNDFSALEAAVERKAESLEVRQKFLEDMIGVAAQDGEGGMIEPTSGEPQTDDEAEDAPKTSDARLTGDNEGPSFIEELLGTGTAQAAVVSNSERRRQLMQRLSEMETRQARLAEALLAQTNSQMASIETALAPTKLDNQMLIDKTELPAGGLGGPFVPEAEFEPVFSADDEKPFLDLMNARQRLEMVTMALNSFPVGKPAEKYYLSSRFGRRTDPFKKTTARHPGLDLAGWPGTAIYATAPGTVVRAEWYGAYGNMVEIDHGNGFKTRYGHMSKLRVGKGDQVTLGQRVGDMGKTGRATDYHVHYEVWFDGQVRDPMPFMKAANDVLEIQGRHEETNDN